MCHTSLKYRRCIAVTKRDIQRLSFALLFHNTVQALLTKAKSKHRAKSVSNSNEFGLGVWVVSNVKLNSVVPKIKRSLIC